MNFFCIVLCFRLHGSYEALVAGLTCEAMEDFTGGVKEYYVLAEAPLNFFKAILKSYERCSLICCGIFVCIIGPRL